MLGIVRHIIPVFVLRDKTMPCQGSVAPVTHLRQSGGIVRCLSLLGKFRRGYRVSLSKEEGKFADFFLDFLSKLEEYLETELAIATCHFLR